MVRIGRIIIGSLLVVTSFGVTAAGPASAATALPEVTGRDGETVLSCRAGDVDALAAALRRGLDDAQLRRRVGLTGRKRVVERWSWRRCAELTVDQYRDVLARRPAVAVPAGRC